MADKSLAEDGFAAVKTQPLKHPFGNEPPATGTLTEIVPGVRWLRMPLPMSLDHINLWLLDDEDDQGPGVAIVDTGLNASVCRDIWTQILKDIRVTRIFVTHFHPDHMGLAGWLAAQTGASLWMSGPEYMMGRLLQVDARETPPDEVIAMAEAAGWPQPAVDRLKAQSWNAMTRVLSPVPLGYHRLREEDHVQIGSRQWRVMMGYGHSPEHACLICDDDALIISGDQILPRITPNVSVNAMEPMADPLGGWMASIERLLKLPADMLVLPAHGLPFLGIRQRLETMAAIHRRQLDELYHFCATPRTVFECFDILFGRPIRDSEQTLASGEAWAHLRRLECEGRVVRIKQEDASAVYFKAI